MFESIRKHSKIVMILLFLLIIPSFIFVGVNQNYFSESSATVARVDGHDIKQADWDNAHRVESDRLRAENPKIDGKLLDSAELRYATLEKMVRGRVIAAAVQKLHLSASDEQLVRTLQTIPAIAELKKPDGSLDQDAYRALVGAQGMTPQAFEANLRYELSMGRVLGGVSSSAFATDAQVKLAMDALYQRREIQLAQFDAKSFAAKVQVSDADLKAYYEAHKSQFQQAEEASIEYIELNMASAEAAVVISEDDLHNYYKQNAERLAGSEERRVSHILIAASKDAPAADREKAKAKAEEILAEVRKDPKRFAEIAKTQSQDPGSASAGGDLGMIARGSMVKPFEDAAFALKAGDISINAAAVVATLPKEEQQAAAQGGKDELKKVVKSVRDAKRKPKEDKPEGDSADTTPGPSAHGDEAVDAALAKAQQQISDLRARVQQLEMENGQLRLQLAAAASADLPVPDEADERAD